MGRLFCEKMTDLQDRINSPAMLTLVHQRTWTLGDITNQEKGWGEMGGKLAVYKNRR